MKIEGDNAFQLYKTTSGSYFIDVVDLKVDSSPQITYSFNKTKESRGVITTDVFDFEYTPTSSISNENGFFFITKMIKINGLVIILVKMVCIKNHFIIKSEILNIESQFSIDIDNDGNFGDKVDVFLTNDNTKLSIYKTQLVHLFQIIKI